MLVPVHTTGPLSYGLLHVTDSNRVLHQISANEQNRTACLYGRPGSPNPSQKRLTQYANYRAVRPAVKSTPVPSTLAPEYRLDTRLQLEQVGDHLAALAVVHIPAVGVERSDVHPGV